MRNFDSVVDIGDLPYEMVRPILKKIVDPEQLRTIESNSPQIAGLDAELWKAFIKRDIQRWEQKWIEPARPESWSKVYRKLMKQDNEERAAAEDALRAALNKSKVEKAANQAQIVHSVIKEPKKSSWGSSWAQQKPAIGQQALKNARSGQQALAVIKRQAAHQHQVRGVIKSTPTHELQTKRGTVTHAPQSMVNQYNKQAPIRQPNVNQSNYRPAIFAPRVGPVSARDQALNSALRAERAEQAAKEQRLRALTGASAPKSSNPVIAAPQPQRSTASASNSQNSASTGHLRPPQPSRTASPASPMPPKKRPAAAMFLASPKRVKR